MRYSLIIPHYDDVRRLDRLLQSVPADRSDLEILVVDDCSPDRESLAALRDRWPGVHWLSTTMNAGAGAARNVGLDRAQGDFLLFADSDDQFLPGAFSAFDAILSPATELVYFLAEATQDVDGRPSNRAAWLNRFCQAYLDAPSDATLSRLKLSHVVPWAKAYSRAFIASIGVRFEEIRFSNDVLFNVLAAYQARAVAVVPRVVYRCYRRPASLTANPDPAAYLVRVQAQVSLAAALKAAGLEPARLPAKTGPLLNALFDYGPITAWQAWRLMRHSDMRPPELLKALNLGLWLRFFSKWRAERAEKKKAAGQRIR